MPMIALSTSTLSFHFHDPDAPASTTFRIFNTSTSPVFFKVHARPSKYFAVRPNGLTVQPNRDVEVTVVRANKHFNEFYDQVRVRACPIVDGSYVTTIFMTVDYVFHYPLPDNDDVPDSGAPASAAQTPPEY